MRTYIHVIALIFAYNIFFTQNQWFEVYGDTLSLNKASEELTKNFQKEISKVDSSIYLNDPKSVSNPMGPFLNLQNNTINLPIWHLAPEMFQGFCISIAGSKKDGKQLFGLFFNGFYVPHELGHALQFAADKRYDNEYYNEYNANIIGLLYWKNKGRTAEFKKCYQYASKALEKILNPITDGEDVKVYFTEHHQEFGEDLVKYAHVQFSQYVKSYNEIEKLNFESHLENYLNSK